MKQLRHILSVGMLIALVSSAGAQSWLTNGLVAYYPFNGNANDESGNGNDGTVYGATLTTNRLGQPNSAYFFNGSSYIKTVNPMRDLTTATFSVWFNASRIVNSAALISDSDGALGNDCVIGFGTSGGQNVIGFGANKNGTAGGGSITNGVGSFTQQITNNWLHFVWVMTPTNQQAFVNGVQAANVSVTASDVGYHGFGFFIGGANITYSDGNVTWLYSGAIDDVRIYNRALSSNEVAQLYALEAPVPPTFTLQPQSLTAIAGSSTNLSVTATGSGALTYQWLKDGVALPGATNATLDFPNLQPVNVGDYVAVVSNGGGSVTSSVASVSIPGVNSGLWQGLVAYYPFNGNANDESGLGNDGDVFEASQTNDRFGKSASAYSFNGFNSYINTKDADVFRRLSTNYTVAFWINSGDLNQGAYIVTKDIWAVSQWAVVSGYTSGSVNLFVQGAWSPNALISDNQWFAICITYDGSRLITYVNSSCVGNVVTNAELPSVVGAPLRFGSARYYDGSPVSQFNGSLDEIRIYNRGLSSNEVAQLYALEAPVPPTLTLQPQSLAAASGSVTNLSVGATGSDVISYQWLKDGVALPGATNATLVFSNLQPANVGDYLAVVSNGGGSVTSSVASVSIPGVNSGVWQGLVAYYPFNGNATDESGFGNDGTVYGAALAPDRVFLSNSSYSFDGSSHIDFGSNLKLGKPHTAFTISLWFLASGTGPIFGDYEGNAAGGDDIFAAAITVDSNSAQSFLPNYLSLSSRNIPARPIDETLFVGDKVIEDRFWHSVVYAMDGAGTIDVFVDGQHKNALPYDSNLDYAQSPHWLAGRHLFAGDWQYFTGAIDDVRIYKRALSSNEVAQLYALEAPVPPTLTLQPQSVTAVAGSSTNLSVTATGSQLLTYQWLKDGVALPGATNASLLFSNLQPVNVGDYLAVVSNGGGSVTSSVASVSIPGVNSGLWQGLVAYYPFNGNANDESGFGNDGTNNGAVLTTDRFSIPGSAFFFGGNNSIGCGSLVSRIDQLTFSAWVKTTDLTATEHGIVVKPRIGDTYCGARLGLYNAGFDAGFQNNSVNLVAFDTRQRADGNWHLAAIVNNYTNSALYVDGAFISQITYPSNYSGALSSQPISIGTEASRYFNGVIDDVRIYNRALSSNEVAQLYALEAPVPPTFTLQPQSLTAAAGSSTNLSVTATGSQLLTYQWLKDGVALPGATNATLAFPNLQPVNVGDYVAVVSNGGGSVTSSVASVSIPGVNRGLWQGLVAYYPFNGNANDESGNGNNGTVYGAAISADRFRNPISAYTFAGSQNIAFGAVPLQQIDDWTLCGWLSASSLNQTSMAITVGHDDGMTGDGFELGISDGTSLPGNKLYGILGGVEVLDSGYAISSVQQWHHVAMIRSGGVTRLYMDGVQTANTSSAVPRRPTAFSIGSGTGIRFFEGQIDDVRIYNRALSSNDVAALYQLETAAPVFVTQPATVTHQIGEAVILSVQSAGGQPTTYTWHFSGAALNSSTNSSLTIASLQAVHLGAYTVVASNQWGMATSSVATVYCPASIIAPPISVVSPLGGQALFLVEAAGYDLPTYQWMFNGTNLPNATASSLAVTNVQLRNAGSYAVVVSNSLGRVTSSVAWLSVSPSLYTPFVGATPIWGRSASIGVSAVGSGQLNFQWYLNGVAIDGATAPSINFPSIQFTNAGMYSVVISSAYGIVTNAAAEVSVNPAEVDLAFYPGLTINGHTGNRYTIQSSSDLSNTNNWITQTNLMLEMDTQLWFDSSVKASDPNNTQYFYRVLPEN